MYSGQNGYDPCFLGTYSLVKGTWWGADINERMTK